MENEFVDIDDEFIDDFEMVMPFTKNFKGRRSVRIGPYVKIYVTKTNKYIIFSKKFLEVAELTDKGFTEVVFYFSKKRSMLGLFFSKDDSLGGLKRKFSKNRESSRVVAIGILIRANPILKDLIEADVRGGHNVYFPIIKEVPNLGRLWVIDFNKSACLENYWFS